MLNGFRMETLQQMVRTCYNGLSEPERFQMVDNVVAMRDLSEDEGSPRHRMSEDTARDEMFQAYQAYQVGLDLVRRIRDAEARQAEEGNEQPEQSDRAEGEDGRRSESSSGSENLPDQLRRYLHIPMEEASDVELWMQIHHGESEMECDNEDG